MLGAWIVDFIVMLALIFLSLKMIVAEYFPIFKSSSMLAIPSLLVVAV